MPEVSQLRKVLDRSVCSTGGNDDLDRCFKELCTNLFFWKVSFTLRKGRRRVNNGQKTVDSALVISGVLSPYHPKNTDPSIVV